jgi:lipopolysaccharide transport system ATP-binding protein
MNENNIAIRVHELGKQYKIGEKQASYRTIRETVMKGVRTPFRKAAGVIRGQAYGAAGLTEEIWALRDVSFEVEKGEVLGIIGRNGAGKTTLLKILSRITEPAEGWAKVYGRVGSLLEVGTGMHPELTGRENIYLNGAVLGMKRAEIKARFDEIVDFSGVEKFIDTPMKHYSSGMQVRLAFSIAAHLEPEILLVDEVLAVGDAEFQKKCLGKMGEVAEGGRTVLFVSHNMAATRELCSKGLHLDNGTISAQGEISEIVDGYLDGITTADLSDGTLQLRHFDDLNVTISPRDDVRILPLQPVSIKVSFSPKDPMINGGAYVAVHADDDSILFGLDYYDFGSGPQANAGEVVEFEFQIDDLPITEGKYYLVVYLKNMSNDIIEKVDKRFLFGVDEGKTHTTQQLARCWRGSIAVRANARYRKT